MKVYVVFYSMYGHVYTLSEAVAEGARSVEGAEVSLFQVPELVPENILKASGAYDARMKFAHIPFATPNTLAEPDAIIFGTPTRYGMMCAQMRNLIDQVGALWSKGTFENKIGSVFTSTGTQHGGQETTITSFWVTLMHLGMILVGVPYSEKRLSQLNEISGGGPYGASTLAGGKRVPSENELEIAKFQGKHVAEITRDFVAGRNAGLK
jgi:NAD(P)H:quinone oxidoreductase type IV